MTDYKPFNMKKVVLSETHMKYWLFSESVKDKLKNKKLYIPTYFGTELVDFCQKNFKELNLKCIYYVEPTDEENTYINHIWTPQCDTLVQLKELKINQLIMLSDVVVAKSDEGKKSEYIKNIENLHRECVIFTRAHQEPTEKNKGHYYKDTVYLSWKKPQKKEKFSPSFKA